nr:DUF3953 domain-containing protein [Salicibibacter cibarius]
MLFLGSLVLVTGISIIKGKYRWLGGFLIIVSLFAFFVSIQEFLMN